MRPALPVVMINGFQTAGGLIQAGIFGIGPNSSLNQWNGRVDVSFQVIWQLEGFGIGNLARVKKQRGEESQAIIMLCRAQDQVAAEVTEARARLQSATARVTQADRALRTGHRSPSTATSRVFSRPSASATSCTWFSGRRKRSMHSSS